MYFVYIWKDIFDGVDRILMANTRIDMTAYIYPIEGDIVVWFQHRLTPNTHLGLTISTSRGNDDHFLSLRLHVLL
ncbi:MAG: hypothetical protein Ct9H90mP16_12430 [Candidatus Poseidoniales archaeon]|nr:MAG: hypothetical protein Ct9H90mP16_12430 [Candidatus Poseidoniales archaeon]